MIVSAAAVYGEGFEVLRRGIRDDFPGRVAVATSFGAESALLLDMVAEIDRAVPVIFVDTGLHFAETLDYRDQLIGRLGLAEVRVVRADDEALAALAPDLCRLDPDACCRVRKVEPFDRALAGFDAWITGRKRIHGGERADLPLRQRDADGRVRFNPLARLPQDRIKAAFVLRDLPGHPLTARGYPSVGCAPCTRPALAGQGPRDGRWFGSAKTECGIHHRKAETITR